MIDNILNGFKTTFIFLFQHDPLKVLLGISALFFILLFWLGHKKGKLDWTDLITANGTNNKVSLTKFLQVIGGLVGTWIVIYQTMHDKLSGDIFLTYLAYVGAINAWSVFVAARFGGVSSGVAPVIPPTDDTNVTTTATVSVASSTTTTSPTPVISTTNTSLPVYGPKVPGI